MVAVLPHALVISGVQYYIYGDAAYMVRPWVQAAFSGAMTDEQSACNTKMAVPRTAVEWGFKDVKQKCAALDYPRKLTLRENPVGFLYRTVAFVLNLRFCTYGSSTSSFLYCNPPSVEQYLGLAPIGEVAGAPGGTDVDGEDIVEAEEGDVGGVEDGGDVVGARNPAGCGAVGGQ